MRERERKKRYINHKLNYIKIKVINICNQIRTQWNSCKYISCFPPKFASLKTRQNIQLISYFFTT